MTAMALLAYLGHCELQDSPEFGETVKRGIDFLTSTLPDKLGNYDNSGKFLGLKGAAIMGRMLIQFVLTHFAKHTR